MSVHGNNFPLLGVVQIRVTREGGLTLPGYLLNAPGEQEYARRRGECQKPGALRRELESLVAEASVQQRGSDLKHTVGASGRPAHLLGLVHAGTHQLIDGRGSKSAISR